MNIHLLHKYVDDCLAVLDVMRLGVRWYKFKKVMLWSQECEDEDKETNADARINTMRQFSLMASDILSCLKFTFDCPEMTDGDGMPVLETEMWIGREQREQGLPEAILKKDKQVP